MAIDKTACLAVVLGVGTALASSCIISGDMTRSCRAEGWKAVSTGVDSSVSAVAYGSDSMGPIDSRLGASLWDVIPGEFRSDRLGYAIIIR